jgi:hypothetical protein
MTKILLMGKNGKYYLAKKDNEGLNLEPNENDQVNARELVPYGLSFDFGRGTDSRFKTLSYQNPSAYRKEFAKRLTNSPTPKDFGRINLEATIEGLEKKVSEYGADYIFVDDFVSRDEGNYWEISGKAQLILKSPDCKRTDL